MGNQPGGCLSGLRGKAVRPILRPVSVTGMLAYFDLALIGLLRLNARVHVFAHGI